MTRCASTPLFSAACHSSNECFCFRGLGCDYQKISTARRLPGPPAFASGGLTGSIKGSLTRSVSEFPARLWEQVFETLTADRDNQYLMIDCAIVRAHQQAASGKGGRDQAPGRSRGGLTTRIHMLADALGRPLRFIITAGQVGEITQASSLPQGQSGSLQQRLAANHCQHRSRSGHPVKRLA